MEINTAGKWIVFAYGLPDHASPGEAVTGDAANITANIRIDGGAANTVDDTNPTELEDGYYIFDITAVESNGDLLLLAPASSTANVQVIAVPGALWTRPANFNVLGIASDGDISGNVDGNVVGSVASVTASVVTDAASRAASKADVSGLATSASITALNDFDYIAENVTLAAATHTGAVIPTVSTLSGHTAQTADHTANIAAILVDTGTTLPATIATIDGIVDAILIDTADLQANQGAWATATGFATSGALATVDGIVDNILLDTAEIGTAGAGLTDLGGMSTTMKTQVNTEALDVLATDTYAEPGQENPAANTTLANKINYLYKAWRNKSEQTSTTYSLYDDAGSTVDQKATVSDNGTTAAKGEVGTGP